MGQHLIRSAAELTCPALKTSTATSPSPPALPRSPISALALSSHRSPKAREADTPHCSSEMQYLALRTTHHKVMHRLSPDSTGKCRCAYGTGLWAPCRRHLIAKEASAPRDEAVAKVTIFFLLEKNQVNKHVNRLKSHVNCWWTYSGYLDDKVSLFQDLNFLWHVKNIICCDLRQLDHLSFRSVFSLFTLPFLEGWEGIPCS